MMRFDIFLSILYDVSDRFISTYVERRKELELFLYRKSPIYMNKVCAPLVHILIYSYYFYA